MAAILEEGWSERPCTTKRCLIIVIFLDEIIAFVVLWSPTM